MKSGTGPDWARPERWDVLAAEIEHRSVQHRQAVARSRSIGSIKGGVAQTVGSRGPVGAAVEGAVTVEGAVAVQGVGGIFVEITAADGGVVQRRGVDSGHADRGVGVDRRTDVQTGAALRESGSKHGGGDGQSSDELLDGEFLTKAVTAIRKRLPSFVERWCLRVLGDKGYPKPNGGWSDTSVITHL